MRPRRMPRLKNMISILVCALLTFGLPSGVVYGMELGPTGLNFSGEVEQTINWFLTEEGLCLGITRYKLSLDQDLRRAGAGIDGCAYVSVKGWYDHEASEGKLLELDEAYVDTYHDFFDLRLGWQVVSWGTAYGFNPTSYVNPLPSMTALTQDGLTGLAGLPVPAVYVSAYPSWNGMSADVGMVLVLNPRLQGVPLPEEAQAMILHGIKGGIEAGLESDPAWLLPPEMTDVRLTSLKFAATPPELLADCLEVAGRAGMNFGMWDLYISGFRGWEDMPVLWVESGLVTPATELELPYVVVNPKASYRKATALGAAVSGTWGPYTFWGEGSYTCPDRVKDLETEGNISLSTNNPYLWAIVGADRMFGSASEYYVMGQYIHKGNGPLLSPYHMPNEEAESGHYLVAVGKATIHDDHQIEIANICNMRDKSWLIAPRYAYKISPMISTWVGTTFLIGDETTEFGSLPMDKRVSAGIKFLW